MQDFLMQGINRLSQNNPEGNTPPVEEKPFELELAVELGTMEIYLFEKFASDSRKIILRTGVFTKYRMFGSDQQADVILQDLHLIRETQSVEEQRVLEPINITINYFMSPQQTCVSLLMEPSTFALSYPVYILPLFFR